MTDVSDLRAAIEALPRWPVFAEEGEPATYGNLIDRRDVFAILDAATSRPAPTAGLDEWLRLVCDEQLRYIDNAGPDEEWKRGARAAVEWFRDTVAARLASSAVETTATPDLTGLLRAALDAGATIYWAHGDGCPLQYDPNRPDCLCGASAADGALSALLGEPA